jgi:hypothetical protein
MAQTSTNMNASSFQETQKQQKKQAKRAAKMQLEIEQARGEVRKAEQKMAKARLAQQLAMTRLQTLEEELKNMQGNNSRSS